MAGMINRIGSLFATGNGHDKRKRSRNLRNRLSRRNLLESLEDRYLLASDLVITGIVDGPLTGGTPKAVEFYAVNAIPDLSIYGFGSANNGGGTDGEEFTFPAVAATAGEFIYVASESTQFTTFFGFAPGYTSGAAGNNGDDAIELFQSGSVVDVFGDINTDGTGEPWEYLDGWAYRDNGTGPDGTTFTLGSWSFSGINALDGESTNAGAATPFPIGTYSASGGLSTVDIAPNSAVGPEGDAGLTDFTFDVTRTGDLTGALTVDYDVIAAGGAGEATLASDFSAIPTDIGGTVSFADGVGGTQTVTVRVTGDVTAEPSETFSVDLSNISGGAIGTGSAPGLILDDDTPLSTAVINEFVFNHTGADTDEYIEILGASSEDLSSYTVLVVDGSAGGVIDHAFPLGTADGGGYQLAGGDVQPTDTFTNSSDQTILLVRGFFGMVGDDIDLADGGTIDNPLWADLIDDVALNDGDPTNFAYSTSVLTVATMNDSNPFDIGGASRIPDGFDSDTAADWRRNDFDGDGLTNFGFTGTAVDFAEAINTPGTAAGGGLGDPSPNALGIPVTESLLIFESDGVTNVSESGLTDTFTIGLSTNPTDPVTVTLTPDAQLDLGAGSGVAVPLLFTNRLPQTVTVTADNIGFDSMDVEAALHTGLITISATQPMMGPYDGLSASSITANIADDDTAAPAAFINEFVINHRGTDTDDFIEIISTASATLSALTVLTVSGDGAFSGTLDAAEFLGTASGDGLAVALPTDPNGFFNNTNILLVEGFGGSVGDDFDVDDDGVFDWEQMPVPAGGLSSAPWSSLRDAVAIPDGGDSTFGFVELTAASLADGNGFDPSGASRIPDATGPTTSASDWVRNDFEGLGLPSYPFDVFPSTPGDALNTPGLLNGIVSGIGVTETFGGTAVEEDAVPGAPDNGVGDSFLLSLDGVAVSGSVTVTVTPDAQLDLGSGAGVAVPVVFAATNGPFSIPVEAVDDGLGEGVHGGLITFEITASTEADYPVMTTAPALPVTISEPGAGTGIVISEIMYNPATSEGGPGLPEWIEIVNTSSSSVDITDWRFDDEDGSDWGLIPSTTLTAGQVAVFYDSTFTDEATFRSEWGVPAAAAVIGVTWGSLSNSPVQPGNEVLTLLDDLGSPIDVVDYDDSGDWPGDDGDASISLTNLSSDNNVGTNWVLSDLAAMPAQDPVPTNPTGPTFDVTDEGSPGLVPAVSSDLLVSIAPAADGFELSAPLSTIDGQFVVSQSDVSASDTDITYTIAGSAASPGDYAALSGTVTIPAGQTSAVIDISVVDDSGFEGTETVELTIDTVMNMSDTTVISGATATIDIFDNDPAIAYALGDVIVNEIMKNPDFVFDSDGEYFEVYNTTGGDVDLNGWTISDAGSDSHTIANGGPLIVPAGGYLVFGTNADSLTNGGITVDYEYDGFFLSNGDDEVILQDFFLTEIDRVEYTDAAFPDDAGASMEFLPALLSDMVDDEVQNDTGSNWQSSTTTIGGAAMNTDLGTPGAVNSSPAPEINVTDGVDDNILDGDLFPSVDDGTDFGAVVIPATATSTFTIENLGAASLDISDPIAITGADAIDFSVTNILDSSAMGITLPVTIAAGDFITFDVVFDPASGSNTAGIKNATVEITNTDLDEGLYDFAITGSATLALEPEISVESNFIEIVDGDVTPDPADNTDFGSVDVALGLAVASYFIDNSGTADLTIPAAGITLAGAHPGDFSVGAGTGGTGFDPAVGVVIAPGGTASFTVTFDPTATGTRTATVNISNDDADENPYDFAIAGGGVTANTNLVINEVDADDAGGDDLEFIEIFGPAGAALDGLTVVLYNGSDDASYDAIDLDGNVIPANGYFVIGSAGVANVDLIEFTTDGLQNGADAVALVVGDASAFPNDTPITSLNDATIVDAIVYDTNDGDDAVLLAELNEVTQYNEDENGDKDNHSNSRVPNGLDSSPFVAQAPTPGENNAPVGDITPPTITDVKVASTSWSPTFLGFIDPGVSEGLSLPGADQLKNLTWDTLDTIIVEFSEDVQQAGGADIGLGDLSLGGLNVLDYELGPGLTASYSDGGGSGPFKLTIGLSSGFFGPEKLLLTIADSVQDAAGNSLDGEWTDTVSTVSGDTTAGGDFSFRIDVLPGDVNQSDFLLNDDINAVNAVQFTFAGGPGYDPFTDIDGSGFLLNNDINAVNAVQFTFLPFGSPTAPPPAVANGAMSVSDPSSSLDDEDGEETWAEAVDAAFGGLF